jgi:hypothetical protein
VRYYRVMQDNCILETYYCIPGIQTVQEAQTKAVEAAKHYIRFGVSCYVEDDLGNRWWPEVE